MRVSRERVRRPWRVQWARLFLGLAVWTLAAVLLYLLVLAPKKQPPNAIFSVCVWEDARPVLVHSKERNERPLCLEPFEYEEGNGLYRVYFTKRDGVFHLKSYTDSMSDPLEYSYRLENGEVVPLWWRHGATIRKMMSMFYSIPLAAMVFHLLLWIMRRWKWRIGKWFEVGL